MGSLARYAGIFVDIRGLMVEVSEDDATRRRSGPSAKDGGMDGSLVLSASHQADLQQ